MLGRTGQLEETQLPDLHARPERDRQVGDVGQLERDVPLKTRIDEPGGRVSEQPKPPKGGLPFKPASQVIRQLDGLKGRPEHELPRMQHERRVVNSLDQSGQVILLLPRIDVRVLGVVEHPEEPVKPNVDTRRLDHGVVKGINPKPTVGDCFA